MTLPGRCSHDERNSPEWDRVYREWMAPHDEALEAGDGARAFDRYPWVRGSDPALTPLGQRLSAARIAGIRSGGVSAGGQQPFDPQDPLGDASYRIMWGPLGLWEVHHGHYDTGPAKRRTTTWCSRSCRCSGWPNAR